MPLWLENRVFEVSDAVESKTFERKPRAIYAGCPSSLGFGAGGH